MLWHVTYAFLLSTYVEKKIRNLRFFCYATFTKKKVHATYTWKKKSATYTLKKKTTQLTLFFGNLHPKKKRSRDLHPKKKVHATYFPPL